MSDPMSDVEMAAVVTSLLPYPADGEVFELTLTVPIAPLDMVHNDGYIYVHWCYTGQPVAANTTFKFKWVRVGYCENWDELQQKLARHGQIPAGQWREAVKAKFMPDPDGVHPRGIADALWEDSPYHTNFFPWLNPDGSSGFNETTQGFNDCWRWLVQVSE